MLLEHEGKRPTVASSAWVAPNAVVCGDVTVGEQSRVLFGAVLTAEGGSVSIGSHSIVGAIQEGLDFPGTVFGLPRAPNQELMPQVTRRYAERFGRHRDDRVL